MAEQINLLNASIIVTMCCECAPLQVGSAALIIRLASTYLIILVSVNGNITNYMTTKSLIFEKISGE